VLMIVERKQSTIKAKEKYMKKKCNEWEMAFSSLHPCSFVFAKENRKL